MLKYTLIFILDGPSDTILMLQRAKAPNKGLLNGVGGKIEPDETPYQAAMREVKEEVGNDVDGLAFVGTVTWEGAAGSDGSDSDGMYVYIGHWPGHLHRCMAAGRVTPEGGLDWCPEEWVVSPGNPAVVSNIPRFLPYMLAMRDADLPLMEHHCTYDGWDLRSVDMIPLLSEVVREATDTLPRH